MAGCVWGSRFFKFYHQVVVGNAQQNIAVKDKVNDRNCTSVQNLKVLLRHCRYPVVVLWQKTTLMWRPERQRPR